jgi:hypothetical protein
VSEQYIGGIASSAIASRKGLGWKQGYAIYLTDRRIIIVPCGTAKSPSWAMNAGARFGSFGVKVTPFVDETPPNLDTVGRGKEPIEIATEAIRSVELKKPGAWYGQGSVRFALANGKEVKLGLLGGSDEFFGEFGSEVCDKLAALFKGRVPELVKGQ